MPDDDNKPGENKDDNKPGKPDFDPITSQADLNKIVGERVARERAKYADYEALKEKAEKYEAEQDAKKTADERAQAERGAVAAKLAAAEAERDAMRLDLQRRALAAEAGLTDPDLVSRVTGADEDEIKADVEKLLKFQSPGTQVPKPNPQQGKPGNQSGSSAIEKGREEARRRGWLTD